MNKRSKSQLCLQLTQENEHLKSKIERSKPILATIYEKVKAKQKLMFDRLNQKTKTATDFKTLAGEYKKLYQESLSMLQKSKTMDKFNHSLSNYMMNKTTRHGQRQQENKNSKSVYEQYKQRIDREGVSQKERRNPQLQNLRKENEQLKQEMITQMSRLKMARTKSLSTLKKHKGNYELKPPGSSVSESSESYYKRKLAERQKHKLANIPP